jgi:hypothetical protein
LVSCFAKLNGCEKKEGPMTGRVTVAPACVTFDCPRSAVRTPEDDRAERIVDAARIVIALVDDRLRCEREDHLVDLDVVIIDGHRQARHEARLEHSADRDALAPFLGEHWVAAIAARNTRRRNVRERLGRPVEGLGRRNPCRGTVRHPVGVVVDVLLTAGIHETVQEGLAG